MLTFFDITSRVHIEHALKKANDKLNLLSRFSADHLHRSVDQILDTVDEADSNLRDTGLHAYFERIRTLTWNVARQLFLTETHKDLESFPPVWMSVQQVLDSTRLPSEDGTVLIHLTENSLRHSGGESNADSDHVSRNPGRS